MKTHVQKQILSLLPPVLAAGVLLCFLTALSGLSRDQSLENKQQLEAVLARTAVACYAAEGIYPPDLQYLTDHYGAQINEELYTVKYEFIASNLMPDITVLDNQP